MCARGRAAGFFAALLMNVMVRGAHASSRAPLGGSPHGVPGETPGTACETQALHGRKRTFIGQKPLNAPSLIHRLRMTIPGSEMKPETAKLPRILIVDDDQGQRSLLETF